MRGLIAVMVLVAASATALIAAGPVDEVPSAFAPFEHMVGGWKGSASPTVNKVKGWTESHGWAWKFDKGVPVGMTLSFENDKTFAKGALSFDPKDKKYHLDGTTPEGKPVAFVGALSTDGKILTLDRVGTTPDGKERLVVRPNSNKIRYTLQLERQATGAPQYKKVIEVGLTKDGESMAAGGSESNLPKCIMTGGASTITVSYMGKSYPVCCTGCRDEFNDNPAKYAAKADAAAAAKGPKTAEKAAPKGKDDGSFDGLFEDAKPKTKDKEKPKPEEEVFDDALPATCVLPAVPARKSNNPQETLARRDYRSAMLDERTGQTRAALDGYHAIVAHYPSTETAKNASDRIKALKTP